MSSNATNSDQLLLPAQGIPRSNTSSEGLLANRRLERNDTSKSTNDMGPTGILQLPTICVENLTKDDIELYTKKQPNIIITIASTVSPPSSPPPETPKKDANVVTTSPEVVSKQTEQEFALAQLEQFKLAAQGKGKPIISSTAPEFTGSQQTNINSNQQQLIQTTAPISTATTCVETSPQPNDLLNLNLPTTMPPAKNEHEKEEFELISFQEEIYEKHFYGKEHWNYFTSDDGLGSVIM